MKASSGPVRTVQYCTDGLTNKEKIAIFVACVRQRDTGGLMVGVHPSSVFTPTTLSAITIMWSAVSAILIMPMTA
jgi:hypothetical protein